MVNEKNESEFAETKVVERLLTDCTLEKVMVYTDRAEVSRVMVMKVQPNEAYEVRLQKLPDSADRESIRIEGKGVATISEVIVERRSVPASNNPATEKVKNLRKDLDELKTKKQKLAEKTTRVTEQREIVKKFADNFQSIGKDKEVVSKSSLTDGMSALKEYLTFYNTSLEEYDESMRILSKEQEELDAKISAVETDLKEIDHWSKQYHDVVILLNTPEDGFGEIELCVRYLVRNAGWKPKYDIRVNGNDMRMQIQYFGLIQQNTGEDWNDVVLLLSTAQPSLGGTVPEQTTEKVRFRARVPKSRRLGCGRFGFSEERGTIGSPPGLMLGSGISRMLLDDDYTPPMAYSVAAVENSVMHVAFSIQKQTSVPSDNQEHRVTIGIITLDAEMEYHCVPKLDANAYITAKVTNTSNYPMLAGASSVFLDNNFVCKSRMKAVSANEEFTCSLGVDPAIRVTYKPIRKFKSEKGFLSKSNSITCSQVTEVYNTRSQPIRLVLSDHLPQSDEDKIKVTLLCPPILSGHDNLKDGVAIINEKHNVEYNVEMEANSKRDFEVKYQIDYSTGEELEFSFVA